MTIKHGIYLFSAQLMGGGVFCGFLILAVRLNTHRLGVINLPLCLKGAYWGGLVAVEKIYNWKCVGKGHVWWLNATQQWVGEWNEALLAVCGRSICVRITAVKRNGMTALICGVEWRSHLCRVVLRWVKWTECNVVKGGRQWGRNAVPRNEMSEENEPTASTWK